MTKYKWLLGLVLCLMLLTSPARADIGDNAKALALNTATSVTIAKGGDVVYFSYKPTATAYYSLSSTGSLDTYCYLYSAVKEQLQKDDDSGVSNNFNLTCKLESGVSYYFGVKLRSSSSTGSFSVRLEKATTTGSCGSGVTWSFNGSDTLTISGSGAMAGYSGISSTPWYGFKDDVRILKVAQGVTTVGGYAFSQCDALEEITLPAGLTTIGERAFSECYKLRHAAIPSGVTSIGKNAFYQCANLVDLSLPDSLKTIGSYAFYTCSSLTELALGSSVTTLEDNAFNECWRIESLSLPKSVKTIGENAFKGCQALASVIYAGTAGDWNAISIGHGNGYLQVAAGFTATADSGTAGSLSWTLSSDKKLTITGSGAMPDFKAGISGFGQVVSSTSPWSPYYHLVTEIYVGNGITRIGDYAFVYFDRAKTVRLPDSVTAFGDYAFYRMHDLINLNMPAGLNTIGKYSLADMCYNVGCLLDCKLPEGLTSIDSFAFYSTDIRRLTLPASLKTIGDGAFYLNNRLSQVVYQGTQSQWSQVSLGAGNDPLTNAQWYYGGEPGTAASGSCGKNVTWTLSQSGVLTIRGSGPMADYESARNGSNWAYNSTAPWGTYSQKITSIQIDSGVTRVGSFAFFYCYNARTVSIADTVTSIGDNAFTQVQKLQSLTLPDSVTTLGKCAFFECLSLSSVKLSSKLTRIEDYCFCNCFALHAITLPSGLEYLGHYAIHADDTVTVPASVTSVNGYFYQLGKSPVINSAGNGNPGGDVSSADSYAGSIHFLGALPDGLPVNALTHPTHFYCKPAYYEAFRNYLLPYLTKLDSSRYSSVRLGTLSSWSQAAKLSDHDIDVNENASFAQLSASLGGVTSSVSTSWGSTNREFMEVNTSGKVVLKGYSGGAIAYAEMTYKSYSAIAFCKVTFTPKQINSSLVSTLPTSGIKANHIATSSTTHTNSYWSINAYLPSVFVESDTSNAYYKELLSLTRSLTSGAANDRERVASILEWVSSNVTYKSPPVCIGETPAQAYEVYVNKVGNCQGYSKLAGFMYSLAGIPSGIVVNNGHMWNIVYLDGKWVMLDPQYGTGAFYADYADSLHRNIQFITMVQGDFTYIVDKPGDVKLAGSGINVTESGRAGVKIANIPGFVTTIFGEAFSNCVNLTRVTIPASVTTIGRMAFENCKSLKEITIPKTVTSIGSDAFDGCDDLTIYCDKGSAAYVHAVTNNIKYVLLSGTEGILTLPAGLKQIDSEAFAGLSGVDRVIVPESVTSIAADAFKGSQVILTVSYGSYAWSWAKENGYPYVYG